MTDYMLTIGTDHVCFDTQLIFVRKKYTVT